MELDCCELGIFYRGENAVNRKFNNVLIKLQEE